MSLYGGNIRTKLRLRAHGSQIAVPGDGPAMRGGLAPLIPRLVRYSTVCNLTQTRLEKLAQST
jgi:hypothetical protein